METFEYIQVKFCFNSKNSLSKVKGLDDYIEVNYMLLYKGQREKIVLGDKGCVINLVAMIDSQIKLIFLLKIILI